MVSGTDTITRREPDGTHGWFAQDADRVVAAVDSDAERGPRGTEAAARPARHGPNRIAGDRTNMLGRRRAAGDEPLAPGRALPTSGVS